MDWWVQSSLVEMKLNLSGFIRWGMGGNSQTERSGTAGYLSIARRSSPLVNAFSLIDYVLERSWGSCWNGGYWVQKWGWRWLVQTFCFIGSLQKISVLNSVNLFLVWDSGILNSLQTKKYLRSQMGRQLLSVFVFLMLYIGFQYSYVE